MKKSINFEDLKNHLTETPQKVEFIFNDDSSLTHRLRMYNGLIIAMNGNSNKKGRYLTVRSDIKNIIITIKNPKKINAEKLIDNLQATKRMILKTKSFFEKECHKNIWQNIKKSYDKINETMLSELEGVTNSEIWDSLSEWRTKYDLSLVGADYYKTISIETTFPKDMADAHKKSIINDIKNAMDKKISYDVFWRNGYDYSISIQVSDDGIIRGYFRQEYKNMGNGYYWLLVSPTKAIFVEKD